MKRTIKILTLFMLLFILSCTKDNGSLKELSKDENETIEQNSSSQVETRDGGNPLTSIINNNGILEFNNWDHFHNSVSFLENEIETKIENFVTNYSDLTDDELNAKEEELGFEDFQPAIDFETSKGFSSRRAFIESAIQTWLNNEVLDDANDPDDWDDLDEETRTFLNESGEVKIGTEVFNLIDISDAEGVLDDGCKRYKRKKEFFYYDNGNKRFSLKVVAYSGTLRVKMKTKLVSMKKGGIFGWKRYKTNVYASVGGLISDHNCIGGLEASITKGPKKRRRIKAKWINWLPSTHHKFKKNVISGYGWANDIQYGNTVTLTW